jgi:pyruvate/2-oxoglutarate dehydrogenase complex dihydrolipoamide acyltransferase (E2) component
LPVLAALIALATVALIAVLASGGGGGSTHKKASKPAPTKAAKKKHRAAQAAPAAATAAPTQATTPATSPGDTVNSFYQHAASHDYESAWAMLTDAAKAQLGSQSSFEAGQSTLRSISFPTLRTTSQAGDAATVELQSNAVHTNRTDHVCGTVGLVRSGSAWLIDAFHLDTCSASQLYPGGRVKGKSPKSPKPSKARGAPGAEGGD